MKYSKIFGEAEVSGRAFVNPDELPRSYLNPELKTATGTVATSGSAGFFSAITSNNHGAVASITAADTYVTVCDVTGAGILYNVISPGYGDATIGNGATLRITIDGDVYEITHVTTSTPSISYRMVLGPLTMRIGSTDTTNDTTINPNSIADPGFANSTKRNGGIPEGAGQGIMHPRYIDSLNLPCCRFKASLKVEAKSQVLGAGEMVKAAAIYGVF